MNVEVQARIAALPARQKTYFDSLLPKDASGAFQQLDNIRDRLASGAIEPEFRPAAHLALVALTEQVSGPPRREFETDAQAEAAMRQRVRKAQEAGDESTASQLQSTLDKFEKRRADEIERRERLQKAQLKRAALESEERQAAYEQRLAALKAAQIAELTITARLSQQEAEAQYEAIYRGQFETSLRRQMNLE